MAVRVNVARARATTRRSSKAHKALELCERLRTAQATTPATRRQLLHVNRCELPRSDSGTLAEYKPFELVLEQQYLQAGTDQSINQSIDRSIDRSGEDQLIQESQDRRRSNPASSRLCMCSNTHAPD